MNDDQLLRYSRHILLPEIDVEGQQALLDARALIIGAGGLGSPAAMYLAAAGVGTIAIADDDTVDLTNLQRQIMHSADMVGLPKVASARATLHRLNPQARIESIQRMQNSAAQHEPVRDCMKCHEAHTANQPALLIARTEELCIGCHKDVRHELANDAPRHGALTLVTTLDGVNVAALVPAV